MGMEFLPLRLERGEGRGEVSKLFSTTKHTKDTKTICRKRTQRTQSRLPLRLDRGETDATLAHRMGEGLGVRAGEVSKTFNR